MGLVLLAVEVEPEICVVTMVLVWRLEITFKLTSLETRILSELVMSGMRWGCAS